MPRVVERRASELDGGTRGWIMVENPAAKPGWYPIRRIGHEPHWVTIDCGRGTPYVVPAFRILQWSPVEPPDAWWNPW